MNVVDVTEGVQASVEVPEEEVVVRVMLAESKLHVGPAEGRIDSVRLTVPVNPLVLETVIVEVPLVPEKTRTLVGLALTLKSWTVYVTPAERLREDPVPVTVTA